jgi:Tol biopolymer transport system component
VAPGMRLTLGIVGLFLVGVISASPAASNNTSGPKPITPAWSPDGHEIAYGGPGIYVMGADGNGRRRLTRSVGDVQPAWSPDGRKLAFSRDLFDIYVMSAHGTRLRRVAQTDAGRPTWSADGRKIAFDSDYPTGSYEIYVMNANGSHKRRLKRNNADTADPAWSPNGRRIAFESDHTGSFEIYVISANGSNQRG